MFGENASARVSGSAFQVSQIQLLVPSVTNTITCHKYFS